MPIDTQTTIDLTDTAPIALGSVREIYQIPDDDTLIVKVYRANQTPYHQKKQLHLRKLPWLRHPISFDQNKYDLRELQKLQKKHGDIIWDHFPHTSNIINTSHGPGLVQERIKNQDGTPAPTLRQMVSNQDAKPILRLLLNQFKSFLSKHHIVIRDLHAGNLLVKDAESDQAKIIMIDGFGNSDFIKIASILRSMNDRKLNRKFNRLIIGLEL